MIWNDCLVVGLWFDPRGTVRAKRMPGFFPRWKVRVNSSRKNPWTCRAEIAVHSPRVRMEQPWHTGCTRWCHDDRAGLFAPCDWCIALRGPQLPLWRMFHLLRRACIVFSRSLATIMSSLRVDDWIEWRGKGRGGVWNETGIVERFPGAGLKIARRTPIRCGHSGLSVADEGCSSLIFCRRKKRGRHRACAVSR